VKKINIKFILILSVVFPVCILFAACASGTADIDNEPPPLPEPENIEQSVETPPPAEENSDNNSNNLNQPEGKAMGFEYDRESLTYELVWSDEFDYEGLPDPQKWDYDTGGHGWGNNELQHYTNDGNAYVDGEKLIIEARAEKMAGREYTSARLVTRDKGDWLYGKIEISAKLPSGLGTWPAIWMLPTDWEYGGWPGSGEIDIMEHVGFDQDRVHASIHTKAFNHMINTNKGNGGVEVTGASEEFHLYSIEWLPDRIFFFIDNEQVYEYDPHRYTPEADYSHWPFDKRFHLLINIALGGNWGGQRGFDPDMLPVTMEIDFVRIYQSPEITALAHDR